MFLASLLVSGASANPFVREKFVREELERFIIVAARSRDFVEPFEIPVDMTLRGAATKLPCDSEILIFVQQGKPPQVRGKRTLEKKPVILRWKRAFKDRHYRILDLQNRRTEAEKLKRLKGRKGEEYAKENFLWDGCLEGVIHPDQFRPGDIIVVELNYDLNEDGYVFKFIVTDQTLREMAELKSQIIGIEERTEVDGARVEKERYERHEEHRSGGPPSSARRDEEFFRPGPSGAKPLTSPEELEDEHVDAEAERPGVKMVIIVDDDEWLSKHPLSLKYSVRGKESHVAFPRAEDGIVKLVQKFPGEKDADVRLLCGKTATDWWVLDVKTLPGEKRFYFRPRR